MPFSSLASPSATIDVLVRHGLYTRKRLGQHFLVDDNVVGRILGLACLSGTEHVLEVGPGIGTLTYALAQAARSVVAVERDDRLKAALDELIAACPNVTVVYEDALHVTPDDLRADDGSLPCTMVANLPYSVAATVVLRFFERLPGLRSATVMVQAEVADRMAADPGTKQYGAYTVKLALRARCVDRFAVPRTCFLPPPRVDSAVVRLERIEARPDADVARASAAADAAFSQRRKTIRNAIASAAGAAAGEVEHALRAAGLDPSARAEDLGVEDFVVLGRVLAGYGILP
ncbi:MAG: 16S rRNA (adenine(1518)-N(6)/adenine(1519)-N(6))-dimethyltransferase RsmA [Coriobacteriia bacterium]|nr:16S rRNA (adenine(1518)-N(6)/adenine(1519)-N(6))-dimethyltransferase RsmA [Coriobacteriia bacterium]